MMKSRVNTSVVFLLFVLLLTGYGFLLLKCWSEIREKEATESVVCTKSGHNVAHTCPAPVPHVTATPSMPSRRRRVIEYVVPSATSFPAHTFASGASSRMYASSSAQTHSVGGGVASSGALTQTAHQPENLVTYTAPMLAMAQPAGNLQFRTSASELTGTTLHDAEQQRLKAARRISDPFFDETEELPLDGMNFVGFPLLLMAAAYAILKKHRYDRNSL